MDTLKLSASYKTLEIEWPKGKKKEYRIDVSSRERLHKWLEQEKQIAKLSEKKDDAIDAESVDQIYTTCESLLENLVGAKQTKDILRRSNGSFITLVAIIAKMGNMANAALGEALNVVESVTKAS